MFKLMSSKGFSTIFSMSEFATRSSFYSTKLKKSFMVRSFGTGEKVTIKNRYHKYGDRNELELLIILARLGIFHRLIHRLFHRTAISLHLHHDTASLFKLIFRERSHAFWVVTLVQLLFSRRKCR